MQAKSPEMGVGSHQSALKRSQEISVSFVYKIRELLLKTIEAFKDKSLTVQWFCFEVGKTHQSSTHVMGEKFCRTQMFLPMTMDLEPRGKPGWAPEFLCSRSWEQNREVLGWSGEDGSFLACSCTALSSGNVFESNTCITQILKSI